MFFAEMLWFYVFLQEYIVEVYCMNRKIITFVFASAAKVLVLCYLLAQYVTVTSS